MKKYIDPDSALDLVLDAVRPLTARSIALEQSLGLVLSEAVQADRDYPPFDKAMMDGFAVAVEDAGRKITIEGSIAAGDSPGAHHVSTGQAVEIMTGAVCPPGTEAVVPIEKVKVSEGTVQLPETIRNGQNIARRGSECSGEQYLLHAGAVITPLVIANLAFFGYEKIKAIPNPTIGIIITGNEITGIGTEPGAAGIRDANGPMLETMCRHLCLEDVSRSFAGDSLAEVVAALERFSACDIIILSGGVSMGKRDYVPAAVSEYGAETVFHKIAQKPGKPMLFARKGKQLVFGLPGNPLSCHLCFHRYISRAIKALTGKRTDTLGFAGVLSDSLSAAGSRTFFQIAAVERGADNRFVVRPLKGKGSADIFTPIRGSAYLRIDPGDVYSEGDIVLFDWFGGERWMT